MTRLADLHQAVQSTLAGKRLGTPVFVRYLVHSQDKPGAVLDRLAHLTATVSGWLGQAVERIYGLGSATNGQISLMVEFAGGGTALIGWARSGERGDGLDLTILGNRGALYHDAGTAQLEFRLQVVEDRQKPEFQRLHDLIERAIRSGRPESGKSDM